MREDYFSIREDKDGPISVIELYEFLKEKIEGREEYFAGALIDIRVEGECEDNDEKCMIYLTRAGFPFNGPVLYLKGSQGNATWKTFAEGE